MFSAAKASERRGARLVSPAKNHVKWHHFEANYLRLFLVVACVSLRVCHRELSKYKKKNKKHILSTAISLIVDVPEHLCSSLSLTHNLSHVSCGIIWFDWWRISKTVCDWIKPTGETFLLWIWQAAGDKSPSHWGQLPKPEMRIKGLWEGLKKHAFASNPLCWWIGRILPSSDCSRNSNLALQV